MNIFTNFKTREDIKLENSKYDQDLLRFPLAVSITSLCLEEEELLINKFIELGALTFGGKKINKDELREILQEYKEELNNPFCYEKDTYISLKFHMDESLRIGISNKTFTEGGTIYDYKTFMEFSGSLKTSIPLKIENSEDPDRAYETISMKKKESKRSRGLKI